MYFNCNPKNRSILNERWQKEFTGTQRVAIQELLSNDPRSSGTVAWGQKRFDFHTKDGRKLVTRIYVDS